MAVSCLLEKTIGTEVQHSILNQNAITSPDLPWCKQFQPDYIHHSAATHTDITKATHDIVTAWSLQQMTIVRETGPCITKFAGKSAQSITAFGTAHVQAYEGILDKLRDAGVHIPSIIQNSTNVVEYLKSTNNEVFKLLSRIVPKKRRRTIKNPIVQ
jgi:hypothetical protein